MTSKFVKNIIGISLWLVVGGWWLDIMNRVMDASPREFGVFCIFVLFVSSVSEYLVDLRRRQPLLPGDRILWQGVRR